MARAVIGGLITSTLLTLVVVPVVYTYLDDFGTWFGAYAKRWFGEPEQGGAPHATDAPGGHPRRPGAARPRAPARPAPHGADGGMRRPRRGGRARLQAPRPRFFAPRARPLHPKRTRRAPWTRTGSMVPAIPYERNDS